MGVTTFIEDIDEVPNPARHLLPRLINYHPTPMSYKRFPVTTMITSRGCPFGCIFCDKNIFGKSIRFHSVDYVMKEIEELIHKYRIKEITFEDDTFTVNKRRVLEICKRLKRLDLIYSIQSRADTLSKEVVKGLAESGCWQIAIGIESGDQRILNILNKGITLKQIRNAVKITEQAGIQAKGFFMIGNPGETIESINNTINFAKSLPLSAAMFTISTPLPGTIFYSIAKKYGEFRELDWSKYSMWETTFIPRGLSKEILIRKHKDAYKKFYFRPSYILNSLTKIRSFHDIKRYWIASKLLLNL